MPRIARINRDQLEATLRVRGSAKEADDLRRMDARRRAAATNIINPNEVKGDYDVSRLLMTTLGGDIRPITHNDLETFRDNVKKVGNRLKKGLTAQQVISLSREEDRKRANSQIHMAVPAGNNKGLIRFVTNASKDSEVRRHHVAVELVNFEAAVASPSDPKKLALWLVKDSPLKYDCDCGRHTFWYRYITTIGGFNAGRAENGFPKIKNPNLAGVACKHVLRVMHELSRNLSIRGVVAQMIDRGQQGAAKNSGVISQQKAAEIAKMQKSRKREIVAADPSKEKAKSRQLLKKRAQFYEKKQEPKQDPEQELYDAQRNLRRLKDAGLVTQRDFDLLMKATKV